MFDSVKTIIGMLEVSTEFAQNITYNRERIEKALPAGHLDATTLADYLVNKASHVPVQSIIFLKSMHFSGYKLKLYIGKRLISEIKIYLAILSTILCT